MKKLRVNVLSVDEGRSVTRETLTRLAAGVPMLPVPVFATQLGQLCGTASGFEVDGDDLWATLWIEDGTPEFARAAAIVGAFDDGPRLVGVVASDLSREALRSLTDPAGARERYTATLEGVMRAMIEWDRARADRTEDPVFTVARDAALVMSLRTAIPLIAGNATARDMLEFIDERTGGDATAAMVLAVIRDGQAAARDLSARPPRGQA